MRRFAERLFAWSAVGFFGALTGLAAAQSANPIDGASASGGKTLAEYRAELERAREDIFERFNASNRGDLIDVTCRDEQPTGSRMRQNVCRSAAENRADATAARDYLSQLVRNAASALGVVNVPPAPADNVNSAPAEGEPALARFEQEWRRLLREDRQFYEAVVKYVELERQYDAVRGAGDAQGIEVPAVAVTAVQAGGPQCEATTLTEYFQRGNVARVSGRVSIAACPAGTTGSYDVVARVRDASGEIQPLEFSETWQRDDAEDVVFEADYPIGEETELVSVRVRGLKCTCVQP